MTQKIVFKKAFGDALKPFGFTNKGQSWYLTSNDVVLVIALQKSDFDEKFYVNFGVWLKVLGDSAFPAENKCHIQTRLTSLFPEQIETIELACRVDTDQTHLASFLDFIRTTVVPFCEECLSTKGLRTKLELGQFKRALVMKSAKDALAI